MSDKHSIETSSYQPGLGNLINDSIQNAAALFSGGSMCDFAEDKDGYESVVRDSSGNIISTGYGDTPGEARDDAYTNL